MSSFSLYRTRIYVLTSLLSILISIMGCQKFTEVTPPKTQLVSASVFKNKSTANSAVAGMYSYMYQLNNSVSTFGGYHLTINTGLLADELVQPAIPENPYFTNNVPVDDEDVGFIWQSCYTIIYNANSIIEGLKDAGNIPTADRNQFVGEALFIRAVCHFYLINLFGDAPLITTTNVNHTSISGRTSVDNVYRQILTDLLEAQQNLSDDYSYSQGERVRANKWVVTAFLSRVYLYQKDWANAEIQAGSVISNNNLYTLLTDLNGVFLKNSQEAIWQFLSNQGNGYTTLGYLLIPGSSNIVPTYALSGFLMNSFEPNDQREAKWVKSNLVNGQSFDFPYKYKQSSSASGAGEYDMVLRLAEQYLIRAEARAEQNNISGSLDDLNMIRSRAGLPASIIGDKDSLLTAILHERQCELFAEYGHRWMDLKRLGLADAVLGSEKPGWKNTSSLLPLPQIELSKNPNLKQNTGY